MMVSLQRKIFNRSMKNIITGIIFFISLIATSQNTGSIAGKLTDKEFNNEPLPFANIIIKGTTVGTTSDDDGLYIFENLEPGAYTLVYSFVGYETQEIEIEVEADKVTEVNVPMGANAALDEIVITTTARKESEIALLLDQKNAIQIKQSIGVEELSRKGVSNAAGAVAKISGISKQESSSNVYVRGLGDRYQNTTLNGLSLPSTDVNKKNIDLGLFSSNIIESIGVSKAYSTNFFADFSAGNVDIVSKSHSGKSYINLSLGSGINSAAIGENFRLNEGISYFGRYNRYDNNPFAIVLSQPVDPVDAGSPINANFGLEGGFTINLNSISKINFFATASFSNGYRFREGEATNFTNTENSRYPNVEQFVYDATTTALANIDYIVNQNFKLKYRSLYINSATDQTEFFGVKGLGTIRDDQGVDEGFFVSNGRFNQDQVFVNQFLGEFKDRDNGLFVDWGFGYNKVFSDEPDRKRFVLQNYQLALDDDPTTNPTFFQNVPFDNQRFFQEIEDDEYNGYVNFKKTFSEKFSLNFTYSGRRKIRNFSAIRYGYDLVDQLTTEVPDVNNLGSILNVNNINIPAGSGLFDIVTLNPIPGQSTVNRPGLPDSRYTGRLGVHAAGINAEIKLLDDKLLLVPGLRVESFDQEIVYDVQGDIIAPGIETTVAAYDNLYLPSLNARYAVNDDMNLRASYSITASFPEFKEVAPFVYEDVVIRYGGNPDLLGGVDGTGPIYSEINNFDLKWEWFPNPGEIISIAGFYKTISDPVNRVTARDATGDQRYFRTGDQAEVLGFELELRKNVLTNTTGEPLLNVGFNFSYTDTNQDLKSVGGTFSTNFDSTESELEGASDVIANADITFTPKFGNYEPRATLVGSYFSDRIFALGAGSVGDIIEESVPVLDFVLMNPITENFEIGITARNLLNPNITLSQSDQAGNDIIIQQFKDGINAGVTLKYKF